MKLVTGVSLLMDNNSEDQVLYVSLVLLYCFCLSY